MTGSNPHTFIACITIHHRPLEDWMITALASSHIQVKSDLHLEAPGNYEIFKITPNSALLGDISNTRDNGVFVISQKTALPIQNRLPLSGQPRAIPQRLGHRLTENQRRGQILRPFNAGRSKGRLVFLDPPLRHPPIPSRPRKLRPKRLLHHRRLDSLDPQ